MCQKCTGAKNTQCQECKKGYFSFQETCSEICPTGYFPNYIENKCQLCNHKCFSCQNSSDDCLSCQQNYYLLKNKCLLECENGYYKDDFSNTCKSCKIQCLECKQNFCTSCIDGYSLYISKECLE